MATSLHIHAAVLLELISGDVLALYLVRYFDGVNPGMECCLYRTRSHAYREPHLILLPNPPLRRTQPDVHIINEKESFHISPNNVSLTKSPVLKPANGLILRNTAPLATTPTPAFDNPLQTRQYPKITNISWLLDTRKRMLATRKYIQECRWSWRRAIVESDENS